MNSIDRRGFLKTTAAWGLAPIPTPGSVSASPSDDDALGVRKAFAVTQKQTYLNSAYVGPMPDVVYEAAVRYADEQRLTPASRHSPPLPRWDITTPGFGNASRAPWASVCSRPDAVRGRSRATSPAGNGWSALT